jgi:SAM-dependent methyltransferase
LVFDFGNVPLAGYFPQPGDALLPRVPMKLLFCETCTLFQITPDISDDYLFRDYRYVSSVGMQSHFNELAEWFAETQKPKKESRIVEFGCNDGPLLVALKEKGFSPIGVDPATNIVRIARNKGLNVIEDFFNVNSVERHSELRDLDFIFSSNSFAHISDIRSTAEAVSKSLTLGGRFIVEVQGVQQMYEKKAFDFIYHEHKYYYSVESLSNLLLQFNLVLVGYEEVEVHGGSLRLVFEKKISGKPSQTVDRESKDETNQLSPEKMALAINEYIQELKEFDLVIENHAKSGKRVAAFGASGRANMLLGMLTKTRSSIEFVVDESPERIGRVMAQNNVDIINLGEFLDQEIDVIVMLAWNFTEAIVSKLPARNYLIIVPLPNLTTITH